VTGGEPGVGGAAGVPATGAGGAAAWAALKEARDAIAVDLEAGRLAQIHPNAARLAPLAKAFLEASPELSAAERARVESAVGQIPKVADALHEAADCGDAAGTRRELGRLDSLLELIRGQYPAGALSPSGGAPGAGVRAPTHEESMRPGSTAGVHQHEGSTHPGPAAGAHPHQESMHQESKAGAHQHAARPVAAVDLPAQATLRVRANEFSFEPRTLKLRAGEPTRIELQNEGALEHVLAVAAPDGSGDWIHLHAPPSGTDAATFRLEEPGRYRLECTVPGHTEAGMVGELVVEGS
jgi:uncharacterized cupredoxin-like copper-binding protein